MLRKPSLTIGIGLSLCALMTLPASAEETMIVSSPTKTDAQLNIDVAYCGNYARRYPDVGERKAQYAACLRSRGDVVTNPQEQTQAPRETRTAETTPTRSYPRLDSLVVSADNSHATYMVMKPDGSRCISAWSKLKNQRVCQEEIPIANDAPQAAQMTSTNTFVGQENITPNTNYPIGYVKRQNLVLVTNERTMLGRKLSDMEIKNSNDKICSAVCDKAIPETRYCPTESFQACLSLMYPNRNSSDCLYQDHCMLVTTELIEAARNADPEMVAKRKLAEEQAAAERGKAEAEDKAAELEYNKTRAPFFATFKIRKDIGDITCTDGGGRGEVEKVYKDKIQVRYSGGSSTITTYDSNDDAHKSFVGNPDTLSWIRYDAVGLCDKYVPSYAKMKYDKTPHTLGDYLFRAINETASKMNKQPNK